MIRIIKTLIFCLCAQTIWAQYKDAGLWAETGLAWDYSKKWEFKAVPEMRFNENISQLSRVFLDLGAQCNIHSAVQVSLAYRTGLADSDGQWEMRNRFQIGLGFKKKWREWVFSYAPRWQMSLAPAVGFEADVATTMRNRLQIKYGGYKDWDFSSSFEFFHSTGSFDFGTWQNWRWTNQANYEVNKRKSVSVGYLIQRRLIGSPQEIDFVIMVGYQYKIGKRKKASEEKGKTSAQ